MLTSEDVIMTTCFRCGEEHEGNMTRQFQKYDTEIRREERVKIAKKIREAFADLEKNNPGDENCEWLDALRAMRNAALRCVGR